MYRPPHELGSPIPKAMNSRDVEGTIIEPRAPALPISPRWKQILVDLRRRLLLGEFDGEFPGELALSAEYGASRGTIRAALRPLREEGALSSERGRKPRIIAGGAPSMFGTIYSLFESVAASGLSPRSATLSQGMVVSADVAARLDCPPDAALFHLSRIRFADDKPIAVDEVWIRGDVGQFLLGIDFADTSLYRELHLRANVTLTGGEEFLDAETATPELALMLSCRPGSALFRIERVGWHADGAIEFRRTCIRADTYSARATFGTEKPSRPTQ